MVVGRFLSTNNSNTRNEKLLKESFKCLYNNMNYSGKSILDVVKFLGANKENYNIVLESVDGNYGFRDILKDHYNYITYSGRDLKGVVLVHFVGILVGHIDNNNISGDKQNDEVDCIFNEVERICNCLDRTKVEQIIELYIWKSKINIKLIN